MRRSVKEIRDEINKIARNCRRTWGMGFPTISMTLLDPLLDELVDNLTKRPTGGAKRPPKSKQLADTPRR